MSLTPQDNEAVHQRLEPQVGLAAAGRVATAGPEPNLPFDHAVQRLGSNREVQLRRSTGLCASGL